MQQYKKLAKKTAYVPFNISDVTDAETIDYNNDANKNDVSSKKKFSKAAKNIANKYKNSARKRKRSLQDDLAYLETLDYNNDTIINDLNNIPSGPSAPKKAKYHK